MLMKLEWANKWKYVQSQVQKRLLDEMLNQLKLTDEDHDIFLSEFISTLGTLMVAPEQYITIQGQRANDMFFIISGECLIEINDPSKGNQKLFKDNILVTSDHFGEIGLLYNCVRSASIISTKYNIFARLIKSRLRQLTSDYPGLLHHLKQFAYRYEDPFKSFMQKVLSQIPYLDKMSRKLFHRLIYLFEPVSYEKGNIIF